MLLQLAHGIKSGAQPQCQVHQANVAQVVGGQGREQQQSYIGGRGAVRDEPTWILLKMVGGQPVVFRADELFKIEPGAASQAAQLSTLIGGKRGRLVDYGATDPIGDLGRGQPDQQQRRGDEQGCRVDQYHQAGQRQRQQWRGTHPSPECPYFRFPAKQADGMRGRGPLQQSLAGDDQADQGGRDSIYYDQGRVGKEDQCQQPMDDASH